KLHTWLLAHSEDFGFYFPFQAEPFQAEPFQTEPLQTELLPTQPLKTEHGLTPLSGVRPEPWHISYFLVSQTLLPQFDKQQLATLIANSDMLLKEAVLARLDSLVEAYVQRVAAPKGATR
ncbi:MAG: hypothetical protein ACRDBI_06820, partial [Shewanella sp.]